MANEEGFLSRWSRRKRADQETRAAEERPSGPAAPPVETAGVPAETPVPPDLPSLETLDKDSDYTVFLQAGVPEAVRQQALRRLWTSDPVLANLDGLLEYGENFRAAFVDPEIVSTLYRVGEGMLDEPPEPPALDGSAPPAESAPTETAPTEVASSESEGPGRADERKTGAG